MAVSVSIRPRSPRQDDSAILQLIRDEIIPYSYLYSLQDAPTQDELRKRLDLGATYSAVFPSTSKPYGFVHAVAQGHLLYVDLLAVLPSCRKRGAGRLLMENAESYGIAVGCQEALLFVDEGNDAARRFYEKLGYRVTGFSDRVRCYEMRKPFSGFGVLGMSRRTRRG
ncbi:ribosomal protein S18 acetylase RimI-like enzyme [Paenibacillus cellulosilyticus]|uniref:Ribosomal protein S18 acetylase RimI-like enzyme n=1 Tax=Paenibacillus cellulosilyticus TaxID=375489 RepID=A0A2V2Z1P2_9BACL|nr:GNAT family N-acetyltransferase [Paenibacillus cellulosilyticus]PWW07471.1 ribosomal protein S18 acetylase RimI-like enzyme [Paenibacillus cellulosilyticus]QKS44374.1 GNAT family N-acetyltransferase [Paenibacillus cellulosilyticus]